MKKILLIFGFFVGCAFVVAGFIWQHILVLAEYNKQIEILGYYKEDIHLLN